MAATGSPKVTPLEGKTTVDDKMVFEPERLSYQSADYLAKQIAYAVMNELKGKTVVIAGTAFLADLANLQAVAVRVDEVKGDYEVLAQHAKTIEERKRRPPPVVEVVSKTKSPVKGVAPKLAIGAGSAALGPVTAGLTAALGLVSLFREDVDYRGIQTVINPLAFELALAAKVKAGGATRVFVPDLVVLSPPQTGPDFLRGKLTAVQQAKAEVWQAVGPLVSELVWLDTELDRAAREKNQDLVNQLSLKLAELRRDLDPVTEPLRRVDQRLADMQAAGDKTDELTGLTMLARWLRAEGIQAMAPCYLHAQVVSSGGHNRTSRSLLRMIFCGDGLSFMGGATARWALLGKDGAVANGGIVSERAFGRFPSWFRTWSGKMPDERGDDAPRHTAGGMRHNG